MVVLLVVTLLVVMGLAVALWRAHATIEGLNGRIDAFTAELDDADNEITAALAEASQATKERDDAFERVQRARRDAAEVAGRLYEEQTAREAAERRADAADARAATAEEVLRERTEELEVLRTTVADLEREVAAATSAGGVEVDQLWSLALAASERLWHTSVAAGPVGVSPLADADDPLRTAIEIEVDAAREEAGAAIELVWELDGIVPVAQAVLALATVQGLVASVAKTAASATLTIRGVGGGVEVTMAATDDDGVPLDVAIAGSAAVAPGRYRVGPA